MVFHQNIWSCDTISTRTFNIWPNPQSLSNQWCELFSKPFLSARYTERPLSVTNRLELFVRIVRGRCVADRNLFTLRCSDQLADERQQSSLYGADSWRNGRRWRNNELNGCKMEVLLNQELLSGSSHTVCLFVCFLSDFNPPWRETQLITGTEILTETHYTDNTTERQTAAFWRRWRKKKDFESTMKPGSVPDWLKVCLCGSDHERQMEMSPLYLTFMSCLQRVFLIEFGLCFQPQKLFKVLMPQLVSSSVFNLNSFFCLFEKV